MNDRMDHLPGDTSLPSTLKELDGLKALAPQGNKYTVKDFFRLPEKTAFKISPKGKWLSYLGPFKRRQNLFVKNVNSGEETQITALVDRNIQGYFWANENQILYLQDKGGDENFNLFGVDIDSQRIVDLTPFENVKIEIVDHLPDNENEVIIAMNKNNPAFFEPYRLNVKTGEIMQLAKNDDPELPISQWMTDHQGRLRLAMAVKNGVNNVILYRDEETDNFEEVLTTDFKDELNPLFFDFENPNICYALSNLGRDKSVAVKFDLRLGKETGELIFEHPEVDVAAISYSRNRKVPTAVSFVTDKQGFFFLDKEREEIQKFLEAALPKYEVAIVGSTKDETQLVVRTYSDRSLGAYFHFDTNTRSLNKIAEVSPWLNEEDMGVQRPVKYEARDGLVIHGYLTLPKGAKGPVPVIINPHGGPWVRDYWGFNPEVQWFAHHGYGVFQMNYRGSKGYGKEFWTASFKEWGRKMQDDISDGVHFLIKQNIALEDRIAIYGGSYGGYATLAGVTFTPDLYCCAIDYVGVSNLFTFMTTIPPYWKPYLDIMYEMVGHPVKDKDRMEESSPVFHVNRIKVPLFVIQGANDPRVNIDESDQIVRSLRERGIEVPYLVKYDEGHGFHNEENRIELYTLMIGFFKKYLG